MLPDGFQYIQAAHIGQAQVQNDRIDTGVLHKE